MNSIQQTILVSMVFMASPRLHVSSQSGRLPCHALPTYGVVSCGKAPDGRHTSGRQMHTREKTRWFLKQAGEKVRSTTGRGRERELHAREKNMTATYARRRKGVDRCGWGEAADQESSGMAPPSSH